MSCFGIIARHDPEPPRISYWDALPEFRKRSDAGGRISTGSHGYARGADSKTPAEIAEKYGKGEFTSGCGSRREDLVDVAVEVRAAAVMHDDLLLGVLAYRVAVLHFGAGGEDVVGHVPG